MYITVFGLSAVVVLVLVLLHLDKKRVSARKAHDNKWKEYYNSLLAVAKLASTKAPTDSVAHEMVMEAARMQILPRNYAGPLRLPELDDYVHRYEQGIALVKQAQDYIARPTNAVAVMNAPVTDVAWKMLYDAILETYLKVSAKAPDNQELHALLLEACCHLEFPVNYGGGPLHHVTRADYVEYYNRGLDILAQINQSIS